MKDRIFREPLSKVADFEFNEDVADVFDDMLSRSIPFYSEIQKMIVDFVGHYYQKGSQVYDLGCSTGTTIAAILQALPSIDHVVGVDSSQAMIDKCLDRLSAFEDRLDLHTADLRKVAIERASVVIMNYTLQFVRPLYRSNVVKQIYDGLEPGGVFLLSEKVLEDSTHFSRLFIDMYYRFKRRQGYSELEISQKRERLENVLVPYKVSELRELLEEAGFKQAEVFFKWHNFASIIAIKQL